MTQRVAWVQLGWSEPLFWRWFLVRMATTTVPALLCFHWGAGLVGLGAMALGALPWPLRLTLDTSGITLTAFLVRAHWAAETLQCIFVELDSRPTAWPRRPALLIQRHGRPATRVFASAAQLASLERNASALGFGRGEGGV